MNSAKKFVDTLAPEDRAAVIAIPGPGEHVDFTTNHDRVRESLLRIVGQAEQLRSRFNISLTEALALYMRSDQQRAMEVILRECGQVISGEIERCEREVYQDAAEMVGEMRRRDAGFGRRHASGVQEPRRARGTQVDHPRHGGADVRGPGTETEELAQLAADSRASLDVLLLDVAQFDVTAARCRRRRARIATCVRTGSSSSPVRPAASVPHQRRRRLRVRSHLARARRSLPAGRGVEARRSQRPAPPPVGAHGAQRRLDSIAAHLPDVAVGQGRLAGGSGDARAQIAAADQRPAVEGVNLTYKEPATNKVRVLAAVEIERLAGQSLEYTTGMALVNRQGAAWRRSQSSRH